jgi:ABC-type amino acid transport substrate-binding protein
MFDLAEFLLRLFFHTPEEASELVKAHPYTAMFGTFLVLLLAATILYSSAVELLKHILELQHTLRGWTIMIALAVAGGLGAYAIVNHEREGLRTHPNFVDPRYEFVRDAVELTWKYGGHPRRSRDRVVYQLVWGESRDFNYPTPLEPTDGTTYYPETLKIDNGVERWWKVRAKVDGSWTPWSEPVCTVHYENSLERIRLTGRLLVGVSSDETQGVFKFLNGEDLAGVDIGLAERIAAGLAQRFQMPKGSIQPIYVPKRWTELFDPLKNGGADLVIAAVTKLKSRETQYDIAFSKGYYCTGKTLIYASSAKSPPSSRCEAHGRKCPTPARDLLRGRLVGYGEATATAELLEKLQSELGKDAFTKRAYPEVEAPIRKLLVPNSGVQLAMTDTAFAEARVLEGSGLSELRLCPCDFPSGYERIDEYAVAVDRNETELVAEIDKIIDDLKKDKANGLAAIVNKAARDKKAALEKAGERVELDERAFEARFASECPEPASASAASHPHRAK